MDKALGEYEDIICRWRTRKGTSLCLPPNTNMLNDPDLSRDLQLCENLQQCFAHDDASHPLGGDSSLLDDDNEDTMATDKAREKKTKKKKKQVSPSEIAALKAELKGIELGRRLFHEGHSFFSSKNYEPAIQCYTNAVSASSLPSDCAEVYNARALCFYRLGVFPAAESDINSAIGIHVEEHTFYNLRGSIRMKMAKVEEGMSVCLSLSLSLCVSFFFSLSLSLLYFS